jgi:KDO2-lipid IV(A) lauroyltransferase
MKGSHTNANLSPARPPAMTHGERFLDAALRVLGLLPRAVASGLADGIGTLFYLLDRRHRRIAMENLDRAFGSRLSRRARRQIARAAFANLCRMAFELGRIVRAKPGEIDRLVSIDGWSHYRQALSRQRGVLILTAHTGNWEMLPLLAPRMGRPVYIVFRPLDLAPLDALMARLRTRWGGRLIPRSNAMRSILSALGRGEPVTILLDQNVGWRKGVFVDFFGQRACTNKGLALLALKTRAPVLPLFIRRDGRGFTAHFGPEIDLVLSGDKTRDLESNTQRYNDAIEAFVRRYPDQWLWLHQRWKTKPFQPWPRR